MSGRPHQADQGRKYDSDTYFPEVGAPTLIIHGEADSLVPVSTSRKLAERIANSKLQIIPSADHFMVVSHAEIIKESIDDFLSDVRRSGYVEQD